MISICKNKYETFYGDNETSFKIRIKKYKKHLENFPYDFLVLLLIEGNLHVLWPYVINSYKSFQALT